MEKLIERFASAYYVAFALLILACIYISATFIFLGDLLSFGSAPKPLNKTAISQAAASHTAAQSQ